MDTLTLQVLNYKIEFSVQVTCLMRKEVQLLVEASETHCKTAFVTRPDLSYQYKINIILTLRILVKRRHKTRARAIKIHLQPHFIHLKASFENLIKQIDTILN